MAGFVTGKNVLITGCTAGIGEEIALQLAEYKPAKCFFVARSTTKATALKEKLTDKGVQSEYFLGDLGKAKDVLGVAKQMLATGEPLHVVVCNAAILNVTTTAQQLQEDDLEIHFMTNYMAYVLLLTELKPLLEQSSPSRIVITGSHSSWKYTKCEINFDNMQGEKMTTSRFAEVNNDVVYSQSKTCLYCWARKFASTLKDVPLAVWDCGVVYTDLGPFQAGKSKLGCFFQCALRCFAGEYRTPAEGAKPGVWAANCPEGWQGGIYVDWGFTGPCQEQEPVEIGVFPSFGMAEAPWVKDTKITDRLWEYTEALRGGLKNKYT